MASQYTTLAVIPIEEVMPYVSMQVKPADRKEYVTYQVKMNSQRLQTFTLSGLKCVHCGLEATEFRLQRDKGTTVNPHLNLWGSRDGEDILFTKDHIVPKSKGGKNHLSNYQTMCETCNNEKGNSRST